MAELAESVGLPKNLTELGIGEDDVPFLVKDALAVTRLMKTIPILCRARMLNECFGQRSPGGHRDGLQ